MSARGSTAASSCLARLGCRAQSGAKQRMQDRAVTVLLFSALEDGASKAAGQYLGSDIVASRAVLL